MDNNKITNFDFTVKLYRDGTECYNGKSNGAWAGVSNYESNLTYMQPSYSCWTNFVVNGTTLINGDNASAINLYKIGHKASPSNSNFVNIDLNPGNSYFECGGYYEIE